MKLTYTFYAYVVFTHGTVFAIFIFFIQCCGMQILFWTLGSYAVGHCGKKSWIERNKKKQQTVINPSLFYNPLFWAYSFSFSLVTKNFIFQRVPVLNKNNFCVKMPCFQSIFLWAIKHKFVTKLCIPRIWKWFTVEFNLWKINM